MYPAYPTPPTGPVPPVEPQTPPPVPPQAPPPVYYYPPAPHVAPSRTNGLAITSMILGILSFFFLGLPLGITAIVLGICSRRGDERLSRMAVAGIVCGILGAVFGVLSALMVIEELMYVLPTLPEMS